MSKLDIKCLDEGYSFVDICGLPLYRGSGLKFTELVKAAAPYGLPLYRGSGLKSELVKAAAPYAVFLCIEEVD